MNHKKKKWPDPLCNIYKLYFEAAIRVFDHYVGLALKGLTTIGLIEEKQQGICVHSDLILGLQQI